MTLQANAETSKVQILESPRLAPGTCVLCGSSRNDDRKYVDIGVTIEYIGVIYFCTFCFAEICNRLGCYTVEQSLAMEDELDRARQRILEFELKEQTIDEAINTLRNSKLFTDTGSSMLTIPDNSLVDASTGVSSGVIKEEQRTNDEATGNAKQSDSKQGSDDVSGITDYDFSTFDL
jgi:hypothetical protein